MIRRAAPSDVAELARLHVAAWRETYTGLLPPHEIKARDAALRREQWRREIARGTSRIAIAPGFGFAKMGSQRDAPLQDAGWTDELYAIYLLKAGQGRGLGRALLAAVRGDRPFTALVVEGNAPAQLFYEAAGGMLLAVRDEWIGTAPIRERVYGFGIVQEG